MRKVRYILNITHITLAHISVFFPNIFFIMKIFRIKIYYVTLFMLPCSKTKLSGKSDNLLEHYVILTHATLTFCKTHYFCNVIFPKLATGNPARTTIL